MHFSHHVRSVALDLYHLTLLVTEPLAREGEVTIRVLWHHHEREADIERCLVVAIVMEIAIAAALRVAGCGVCVVEVCLILRNGRYNR